MTCERTSRANAIGSLATVLTSIRSTTKRHITVCRLNVSVFDGLVLKYVCDERWLSAILKILSCVRRKRRLVRTNDPLDAVSLVSRSIKPSRSDDRAKARIAVAVAWQPCRVRQCIATLGRRTVRQSSAVSVNMHRPATCHVRRQQPDKWLDTSRQPVQNHESFRCPQLPEGFWLLTHFFVWSESTVKFCAAFNQ